MKLNRSFLAFLLMGVLSTAAPTFAQQPTVVSFSAEFLVTDPEISMGGSATGKVYIDAAGMRVENENGGEVAVTILDFVHNTMTLLDTRSKTYSSVPLRRGGLGAMQLLFSQKSAPCGDGEVGLIHATKVAVEPVDGRSTEKWRCAFKTHSGGALRWTIWYDTALSFPLRMEVGTGLSLSVKNIVVGPQPAPLFRIPAGYAKRTAPKQPVIRLKRIK